MKATSTLALSMLCLSLLSLSVNGTENLHSVQNTSSNASGETGQSTTGPAEGTNNSLQTTAPTMLNDNESSTGDVTASAFTDSRLHDSTETSNPLETVTSKSTRHTSGKQPAKPRTPLSDSTASTGMGTRSVIMVLLFFAILILLVTVFLFKVRNSSGGDSRLLAGAGERVRGWRRATQAWLGLHLCPRERGGVEEEDNNEEKGVGGGRPEEGSMVKQPGERTEEEENSSDDYSSLEGFDLRNRANQEEEEERKNSREEEDRKGRNDGEREFGEAPASVVSNEEKSGGCDVTVL